MPHYCELRQDSVELSKQIQKYLSKDICMCFIFVALYIFEMKIHTQTHTVHHRLTEIIGLENLHYLFLHSKWSMNGFLKSGQRLPQISIHLVIKSEYINQWLAQMRIVKSIVSSNQHRSICSDQNRSMVWKIRKDQAMVCKIQNQTINDLLKYE